MTTTYHGRDDTQQPSDRVIVDMLAERIRQMEPGTLLTIEEVNGLSRHTAQWGSARLMAGIISRLRHELLRNVATSCEIRTTDHGILKLSDAGQMAAQRMRCRRAIRSAKFAADSAVVQHRKMAMLGTLDDDTRRKLEAQAMAAYAIAEAGRKSRSKKWLAGPAAARIEAQVRERTHPDPDAD